MALFCICNQSNNNELILHSHNDFNISCSFLALSHQLSPNNAGTVCHSNVISFQAACNEADQSSSTFIQSLTHTKYKMNDTYFNSKIKWKTGISQKIITNNKQKLEFQSLLDQSLSKNRKHADSSKLRK